MENIHSDIYSLLVEQYLRDPEDMHQIFNAIQTMPAIAEKAQWLLH